jgi:hypothetical protein
MAIEIYDLGSTVSILNDGEYTIITKQDASITLNGSIVALIDFSGQRYEYNFADVTVPSEASGADLAATLNEYLQTSGGGGGGGVESVTGAYVNNTDPSNPVINTPYRVYTAQLTQTGTAAPVATILENTLGFTPIWARDGVGQYSSSNTEWIASVTNNKVFCIINPVIWRWQYNIFRISADRSSLNILIVSGNYNINTATFTGSDGILQDEDSLEYTTIEIRVYS